MNDNILKKIRRLRNRFADALLELDALEDALPKSAPEPARKRKTNKYRRHLELNEAAGSWRKPAQLKSKAKKSA